MINVSASIPDLKKAINGFKSSYHSHYAHVRAASLAFLAGTSPHVPSGLADNLKKALDAYGAGRRGAPRTADVSQIVKTLILLRPKLKYLQDAAASRLNITPAGVRTVGGNPHSVPKFDQNLLDTVRGLSDCLTGNTGVTYPMKALMLLTGITPAFDSQVKGGMTRGGFGGMAATRFLLPDEASSSAGRKIVVLPFRLTAAYVSHPTVAAAVGGTPLAAFAGDIGRIFDVLLFVQNERSSPILVKWVGPGIWY
jgi:hypothetical protein